MNSQFQKWDEVVPSVPGANDGRGKWAEVDVIGGSLGALSVTTPSCEDEAQAENSPAITKASSPPQAERLFTRANLLLAKPDATSGLQGMMLEEMRHEKILRGREARV